MFSGAQISLYPMSGDFVDVITGALRGLDPYRADLFRTAAGKGVHCLKDAIGTIDPVKREATGQLISNAGILKDGNGAVIAEAPDFTGYYSNDYLGDAQ